MMEWLVDLKSELLSVAGVVVFVAATFDYEAILSDKETSNVQGLHLGPS
jgi:hypothetical protein